LIYGSNYGPWLVVFFEMLPAAYDSGVTILRFPAGSWGDHNDVKSYQIDQFMDFADKVGAEALFTVRLLDGTPEQAAEMVRYTNIEKKYDVQYWNIGNEPTLYNGELKNRGETYDVNRFNQEWRAFAEAMREVDPTIKLVGPEINQFSHDTSPGATTNFVEWDETWMIEFLKANGDLVDVVSFHRYPFPATRISGAPSMDELRLNAQEWDRIMIHARELIHEHTGRDIPIAVTEFNSAYDKSNGGETTPDSHFNAIWMADVLGRMIKNGVFMANQWALTAKAGYGGLGLIAQDHVFPSYYTYQMYKQFGNELVYSSSDEPDLSIYAAIRKDGVLTIIVVNLSLEAKEKRIQIGTREQAQAGATLFDPTHNAEPMGGLSLSQEIIIAPQSVLLLEVEQYR
jgi:alpha-L-arabinofuranosidase